MLYFPQKSILFCLLLVFLSACAVAEDSAEDRFAQLLTARAGLSEASRADPGYMQYLERQSLLGSSAKLAQMVSGSNYLWRRPHTAPQPEALLARSSVWLYLNPQSLQTPSRASLLSHLTSPALWISLNQAGITGLYLAPTGGGGSLWDQDQSRGLGLNDDVIQYSFAKNVGTEQEYLRIIERSTNHKILLGGDLLPVAGGIGPDFMLATRNLRDYPGLFCMIEVPRQLWELLPGLPARGGELQLAPLSAGQTQRLSQEGLFPARLRQDSLTALIQTGWAATSEVRGTDGNLRRWVYRYAYNHKRPILNFADPTGAARQVMSGSVIYQSGILGNSISGYSVAALAGIEPDLTFNDETQADTEGQDWSDFDEAAELAPTQDQGLAAPMSLVAGAGERPAGSPAAEPGAELAAGSESGPAPANATPAGNDAALETAVASQDTRLLDLEAAQHFAGEVFADDLSELEQGAMPAADDIAAGVAPDNPAEIAQAGIPGESDQTSREFSDDLAGSLDSPEHPPVAAGSSGQELDGLPRSATTEGLASSPDRAINPAWNASLRTALAQARGLADPAVFAPPLEVSNFLAAQIRAYGSHAWLKDALPLPLLREALRQGPDLALDSVYSTAAEHALLTGDASLLNFMTDEALNYELDWSRLVHAPIGEQGLDYTLPHLLYLMSRPATEEIQPGRVRKAREIYLSSLVQAEARTRHIGTGPSLSESGRLYTTPAGLAALALGLGRSSELTADSQLEVRRGHLLLTFFRAMQPGVLIVSGQDVTGALPVEISSLPQGSSNTPSKDAESLNGPVSGQGLALLGSYPLLASADTGMVSSLGLPRSKTLYGTIDSQVYNPDSFYSRLGRMLRVREQLGLAQGKVIWRFQAEGTGISALLIRLPDGHGGEEAAYALAVVNFSRDESSEALTLPTLPELGSPENLQASLLEGNLEEMSLRGKRLRFVAPGWSYGLILLHPES